mgnify:CR=1 FL=1
MINKIKDLEKYYMQEITKVVESIDFQNDLKKLEEYIIVNYDTLREHSSEENKIKVGAERLIRYYFYTNFKVIDIYPSPISSDMAVELKDVILNIDAKTINMITNGGDDNSIHFQKNQITFDNQPFYKQTVQGYLFGGAAFPARMVAYHNNKPVLTFFITINYEDTPSIKEYKLTHMSVCTVPHKDIVKKEYDNDILENLKSWGYIGSKEAEKLELGMQYKPLPKSKFDSKWIPFNMKKNEAAPDAWLDPNLDQPHKDIGGKCVRKIMNGSYKIVSYGISSRISKEKITDRTDSKGKNWKGYKKIEIKPN